MQAAAVLRDRGHGGNVSYSRKVFIPLTKLCRNSCHYCTFAHPPRRNEAAYSHARRGARHRARRRQRAGCHEALFTLGDKPELRYQAAREALNLIGLRNHRRLSRRHEEQVLRETGLLPHVNAGVMTEGGA